MVEYWSFFRYLGPKRIGSTKLNLNRNFGMQNKKDCSVLDLFASTPALSSTDIHIWGLLVDLPQDRIVQLAQRLSGEEIKKSICFRFERDRKRYIARRAFLRMILGFYLDCQPREILFSYGSYGKPMLHDSFSKTSIHFNLSHSNGFALCAVTRDMEIGIDLELIKPLSDMEEIVKHFFSPNEKAAFDSIPASEKLLAFYNCWTRKEAFIKAGGQGLAYALSEFDVSLAPGEPARILGISGNTDPATCWSVVELTPASDYVAAIAYEGKGKKIVCFEWGN
jgi:4'-phosphopantetheinyl transferase